MPDTVVEEPSELDVEQQFSTEAAPQAPADDTQGAIYRRGVQAGGNIVFDAVMGHESNAGRGMDLYLTLKDVAANALAGEIIVRDPDEQPLWEHLIEEAFWDFKARRLGFGPYEGAAVANESAFKLAVRSMLCKKLSAPDSENMRLRQALCDIHRSCTGETLEATDPLDRLLATTATRGYRHG